MKLNLPKVLLMALLAPAVNTAQAVYYSPVHEIIGADGNATFAGDNAADTGYKAIVKDGVDTIATVTGKINSSSSFFVREGQMLVGDGATETTWTINKYIPHCSSLYYGTASVLSVGGMNAEVKFDKSNFIASNDASDLFCYIGTLDGNGCMTLENGSNVDLAPCSHLFIGVTEDFINAAANNATLAGISSSENDLYSNGQYTIGSNGKQYSKGTLNITGGSRFQSPYSWVYMGESEVNVSGQNSEAAFGYYYGKWIMMGAQEGSSSVINIKDGGKVTMNASLVTNQAGNTTSSINVDGNNSKLIVEYETPLHPENPVPYPISVYISQDVYGIGNSNLHTYINVTNGAEADIRCDNTYLCNYNTKGDNTATIYVDSDSSLKAKNVYTYNGSIINNEGSISVDSLVMNGGVFNNAGILNISKPLNVSANATFNMLQGGQVNGDISALSTYSFTLTNTNLTTAANTLTANSVYDTTNTWTIKLAATENLQAGRYKLLDTRDAIDKNDSGTPATFEVEGLGATADDLEWLDGILYVTFNFDVIVVPDNLAPIARDPLADVVQAANWGVYHSSQAFTSLLWAPHTNAVKLTSPGTDEKGVALPTQPVGYTLAWASVYSSFAEHCGSNGFADMDYSIVGGAVGVEHRCAGGSSIGIAFGYDWGKASPKGLNNVDQESMHAALYGRAFETGVSRNGKLALDWNAAVGQTESDHKLACCDWTQNSMQLDARLSYIHAVSERTAVNAFVGMQYYAQDDDSTDRIEADSMQNLRAQFGVGVSHQVCEKAVVFAEASVYRDIMRHNPEVNVDGFYYGSGANPGRTGGNITVGAEYSLTPNWTLRGSYGFEVADHLQQHNANVGAVYTF